MSIPPSSRTHACWQYSSRWARWMISLILAAQTLSLGLPWLPVQWADVYASTCSKPAEPSVALSGSGDVLGEVIDAYEMDGRCFYLIERPEGSLWAHEVGRFNIRSKTAVATAQDVIPPARTFRPPAPMVLPPRRLPEQHMTSGNVEVPTPGRDSGSVPVSDSPVPPAVMSDHAVPEQSPRGGGKSALSSRSLVVALLLGVLPIMGVLVYRFFRRRSGGRASAPSSDYLAETDNRTGLQGTPVHAPASGVPVAVDAPAVPPAPLREKEGIAAEHPPVTSEKSSVDPGSEINTTVQPGEPVPRGSNDAERPRLDPRLAPEQRGGRPRGAAEAARSERTQIPVSLRCELVCWKSGRQWLV